MKIDNEKPFNKGRWLINNRRGVQIFSFILFFFLLFHTQTNKDLEIPILNYLFYFVIILGIIYLFRFIRFFVKERELDTLLIYKFLISFFLVIVLGFLLSYFHQFDKPERITYLEVKSNTIQQAIVQYSEAKNKYLNFRNFTSIKTHISSKTESNVLVTLPPFLLMLLYSLLAAALILLFISGYYVYKKKVKELIKPYFITSLLLFIVSILTIALLDFDPKAEYLKYKGDYGYILNFFPTDFNHFNYFITIPQNVFLKSSSLLGLTTSIALQAVIIGIGFILFFLVISFVFGRVFCGWVCPFGTFHQIMSFFKMKVQKFYDHEVYLKKQKIKYSILTIILLSALFSINLAGFLDPISVVTKSTAIFLVPATQYTVTSTYEPIQKKAESEVDKGGGFFTLLDNLYRPAKEYLDEYVFYFTDPAETARGYVPTHYSHFFLNGVIFLLLIFLNLKTTRFWCRYICPLGALLGITANRSIMRIEVNDNCTSCGDCEKFCQGAADVSIKNGFKTSECMYCFNCMDICPSNALDVTWSLPQFPKVLNSLEPKAGQLKPLPVQNLDLNKRHWVQSLGIGFASVLLLRAGFWEKRSNPIAIRPPGSVAEADFLAKCIKCSECMKVCPKNYLHPAFLETGLEGMFTPIGIGTLGYCEHTCNACGQVCPTQAIESLTLPEKQEVKIGLAIIRKDRCLTYASQTPCVVCEEHCPTTPKAIWTEQREVVRQTGEKLTIGQINVTPDLCIGCAICEYVCPVVDKPAIFVSSIQESRSKENQLLLREEKEKI